MPKELFVHKVFREAHQDIIDKANEIIKEYQDQGFTLTLRQLYYQFVARAYLENKQTEYKRLANIISDARLAGEIDWFAIEDRTRFVRSNPHWDSPSTILETVADQFAYDKWAKQPNRVEVWIEKDALTGVIEPACTELDVPYFACRGYSSQSEQWRAGRRFKWHGNDGQKTVILHLGDHDPSGIDMTRDNASRLTMFSRRNVEVKRLALNMDQVEEYDPPPNPAKMTDPRAIDYIQIYGDSSWELDSLSPTMIDALLRDHIIRLRDQDLWDEAISEEEEAKNQLQELSDRWLDVVDFLEE